MVSEADVEQVALEWLSSQGWQTAYGPDIAPDTQGAERTDFTQVVLEERLRNALLNLNPEPPTIGAGDRSPPTSSTRMDQPRKPGTGPSTTPSPGE